MKNIVNLCQITMNAGDDIPGSVIKWNLKEYSKYFKHVYVVDGHLTEQAKEFYSQFENVTAIDSPWKDSYVQQYRAWRDRVPKGEWALYLDCDEVPSRELANFISGISLNYNIQTESEGGFNTLCLPCVLYLTEDGKKYVPVEEKPEPEYVGQWMKNILVLNDGHLNFRHFGSHVIPTHEQYEKGKYFSFPYYHMKSLESFCQNDVWQAFLSPEGQHYSPIDSKIFRTLSRVYQNTKEFKKATKDGTWPKALEVFAWNKRKEINSPISRLAWTYWILNGHEMPERDNFMTWDNVKNYILGEEKMNLFNKNRELGNIIEVEND